VLKLAAAAAAAAGGAELRMVPRPPEEAARGQLLRRRGPQLGLREGPSARPMPMGLTAPRAAFAGEAVRFPTRAQGRHSGVSPVLLAGRTDGAAGRGEDCQVNVRRDEHAVDQDDGCPTDVVVEADFQLRCLTAGPNKLDPTALAAPCRDVVAEVERPKREAWLELGRVYYGRDEMLLEYSAQHRTICEQSLRRAKTKLQSCTVESLIRWSKESDERGIGLKSCKQPSRLQRSI